MAVRRRACRAISAIIAASVICCIVVIDHGHLRAEDGQPPSFSPGEISIGEPLHLPQRRFPAVQTPSGTDAAKPREMPTPPASVGSPGNGWIGLAVDEKIVTGRLVVVDVATAGPADRAGIRLEDQLLAIDGVPLRSADQLAAALAAIAPGSAVKVSIGRGDQIDELSLTAQARPAKPVARDLAPDWQPADTKAPPLAVPAAPPRLAAPPTPSPAVASTPDPGPRRPPAFAAAPPVATPPAPASDRVAPPAVAASGAQGKGRTALGVRTLPVDPAAQERFRLTEPSGALVIGVVQDLPASKAGVPPGSVIVALDNQPVRSPSELTRLVTSGPVGRPVTLQYILPGGEQRRAEVSLQSLEVPLERALVGPEP